MRRILSLLLMSLLSFSVLLFATPLGWSLLVKQVPSRTEIAKTQPAQGSTKIASAKTGSSSSQKSVQRMTETSPQPTPEMLTAARSEMLHLINEERSKAGVKPLEYYSNADPIAQYRAEDMVKRGYFGHVPPGETPLMATRGDPESIGYTGLLKRAGILGHEFGNAGENCHTSTATEFEGYIKEAHTSLMNSPGHRANILSDAYTHVSIGISRGSVAGQVHDPNQGYTLVQIFLGPAKVIQWEPGKEYRAR